MKLEAKVYQDIDKLLTHEGWTIHDIDEINLGNLIN